MRGENASALAPTSVTWGSSPHARGKPHQNPRRMSNFRLIPACAGKTRSRLRFGLSMRAHPRMRGENKFWQGKMKTLVGSSPHARGKQILCCGFAGDVRLIPACAGKTSNCLTRCATAAAHPRMRGENGRGMWFSGPTSGSSPHARGKLRAHVNKLDRERLIPACAGKTSGASLQAPRLGAHPRMRGEN